MVNKTRQGAASIYVVAVTALLFVIIVISFVRIISSDSNKTSEDVISQNAYDAAMSGIEDAKIALSSYYNCLKYKQDNKSDLYESSGCVNIVAQINNSMNAALESVYDAEKSCDGITKALGRNGFNGNIPNGGPVEIRETVGSSDGPSLDQAYTCISIANSLSDYRSYLNTSSSTHLVPLVPDFTEESTAISHVRISWFTRENAEKSGIKPKFGNNYLETDNFLSSTDNGVAFRSKIGEEKSLLPPVLAVQFFQFPASGIDLWSSDDTSSNLHSNKGEVWLVPKHPGETKEGNTLASASGNVFALSNNHYDGAKNSPYTIECDPTITNEFACSAILALPTPVQTDGSSSTRLDNSKGGATFLNISMPYGDNVSDFSVELCTNTSCESSSIVNFKDVQISVDSTGRTNDFYRRVETRMELRDISFPVTSSAVTIADSEGASLEKNFWVTKNCWKVVDGAYDTCDNAGTDDISSGRYVEYTIKYDLNCSAHGDMTCPSSASFPTQSITKTGNQPNELNSANFTLHSSIPSSEYEFLYWETATGERYNPGQGVTLTRPDDSTKKVEVTLHAVWGDKKFYAFSKSGNGSYIYIKKLDASGAEVSDVISGSTILHRGDRIAVHYGTNSATSSGCGSSFKYHPTLNKFFALGQTNTYYGGSGEELVSDANERIGRYEITDSNLYFLTEDLSSRKFTITYNKNATEATGSMPVQEVPCDAITTTLMDNAYTYNNHSFLGWYTSSTPSQDEAPLTSLHIDRDLTVYAKWSGTKVRLEITDSGTKTSVEKRIYDDSPAGSSGTSGTDLPIATGYELEQGETLRFSVMPDTCYNPATMKSQIYFNNESSPRGTYNVSRTTLAAEDVYNENNQLIGHLPERFVYSLGGSYELGNNDTGTLHLKSTANKYTYSVTYKSGAADAKLISGTGDTWVDTARKTCGERNYTVRDNNGLFERQYYRFTGWKYSRNTRNDSGNTILDERTYLEKSTCGARTGETRGGQCDAADYYKLPADYNQDVVLTAQWIRQYNINFYQNASTSDTKVVTWTQDVGTSFAFPSLSSSGFTDFYKEGYSFIGWSTVRSALASSFAPGTTYNNLSGNINLYAIWEKDGPKIKDCSFALYYGNGGTNQYGSLKKSSDGYYTIDANQNWTLVFTSGGTCNVKNFENVDIYMLGGGGNGWAYYDSGISAYSGGGDGGRRKMESNKTLADGSYYVSIGGTGSDSSFGSFSSSGGSSSGGGEQSCGCAYYEENFGSSSPGNGDCAFGNCSNGIGVSGTTGTRYGGGGGAGNCVQQCYNESQYDGARSGKAGGGNGCYRGGSGSSASGWSSGTPNYGGGGGGACIGAWWNYNPGGLGGNGNGYAGVIGGTGSGSSGFVAVRNHR